LLLLLAVCAIPFALAQRNATKRSMTKPNAVAIAQLPQDTPSLDGTVGASRIRAPAATDLALTRPLTNSPAVCGGTCTSYNFTLGTATFVPGVTDTGNHCDDCLTSITLPFSVNLYDQSFTTASVGSNGSLHFGVSNPTFAVTCSPFGVAGTTYTMGPYWTDQCTNNTGACSTQCIGCGIFTTTTGTAPNRVFYIEYRTSYFFNNLLDYEIALNENGSPPFRYIYNTINATSAPNTSQLVVGVKKDDTTFTQYGCDTTGGTNPPVASGQALTAQCVGRWQTEPSMLAARAFASGAVARNAFYVLAGYNGTTPYVTETDFFNGTTWATGAPIPTPHSQSKAAAIGNNIYVPGGFNSVSFGGPLNFMQIYNTTANTWSNGMNLPAALVGPAVAAFNGKVYIIGGFTTPFPTGTSTVYIYDPVANSYTTGAAMPAPAGNVPGALLNGEIYVVGGSTSATLAHYAYNPTSNTWRTIAAPSPADCQGGGAFALNGQLWLVGCLGQTGTNSKIYNPVSDSWSAGPPLNTSQEGGSATSIYNALDNALGFVAGGGVGGAASTTVEAIHNGKPDYVLYNGGTRQTAVWYMNNNVLAGSAFGPTLPADWYVIDVTDFNGDGNPDYALFNPTTRQTAIWYLSGVTFVGGLFGPTLPSGWTLVATGDFNDDCKPDYVLYNASTRQTAIWYMNNNVFVNGAFGPTLPPGWSLAGVADFDGDRNRDYLLFNASTRETAIWYLSGVTFVGSAFGPTIASGYQLQGTADFNQDGKPDYLLYNPTTRQTAIWYLNNSILLFGAFGPILPTGWNLVAP